MTHSAHLFGRVLMTADLIERLRSREVSNFDVLRNPDGLEAATKIERLTKENERLSKFNTYIEGADDMGGYPERIWFTPEDNSSAGYIREDVAKARIDQLTSENTQLAAASLQRHAIIEMAEANSARLSKRVAELEGALEANATSLHQLLSLVGDKLRNGKRYNWIEGPSFEVVQAALENNNRAREALNTKDG